MKEIVEKKLAEYAQVLSLTLPQNAIAQFSDYAEYLVEYNKNVNLTAITSPEEIVLKHFIDSLYIIKLYSIAPASKMADIGSGAGFPGVPLKLALPDLALTTVDSLKKRVQFLEDLSVKLNININCLHQRAEEGGLNKKLREQFDIVSARAVARLAVLCEYCLPYVKLGGAFIALKGPNMHDELDEARFAIHLLGGEIERFEEYALPEENYRSAIIIKKISRTPSNYPRAAAKMAKCPLIK